MDSIEIGQRIKKYRLAKGLTQKQLAELLYIDDKKVSKWETGRAKFDLELITQICNALNISVHDFLEGIDQKPKFEKITKICIFVWNNIFKIIFILFFIYLLIYFIANFNAVRYYNIKTDSTDLNIKNGMFLESKVKNVLVLNNITIYNIDYDILNTKLRLYTYVNGDKVYFYEQDNLNSIMIEDYYGTNNILNKEISKAIKKGLYLTIDLTDSDKNVYSYEIKLDLIYNFSNTKLAYIKNTKLINEEKEENNLDLDLDEVKLLNNGFKKDEETDTYNKEIKKDIVVNVDLNNNSINIYVNNKTSKNNYSLFYKKMYLKYISINNLGESVINYTFNFKDNKISCYKGNCENYLENYEYVTNLVNKLF